jgi:hypothetical protein
MFLDPVKSAQLIISPRPWTKLASLQDHGSGHLIFLPRPWTKLASLLDHGSSVLGPLDLNTHGDGYTGIQTRWCLDCGMGYNGGRKYYPTFDLRWPLVFILFYRTQWALVNPNPIAAKQ